LVELIVVMGVIGILSAIAVPSLRSYQVKARVKEQAYLIADLLYAAQEKTLAEQDIYGVSFTANSATLLTYGESYEEQEPEIVQSKNSRENVVMSNNTIIDAGTGANLVRFSRSGVPSTTGSVELTIVNTTNPKYIIEVKPSGSIKVNMSE